jgi:L-ascorbate metabolism protein UlaG (beta-lactamase superfamily)
MEITWYGLSCFRMTERGLISVVADPFSEDIGLKPLKLKADVVTISHDAPGHNNAAAVKGVQKVITGPGEYEVGGVFITGIRMRAENKGKSKKKANTLYVFDFEGITVAHLGDLNEVPSQAQIEALDAVDIALVPVGGGGALNPSQAAEVISLIEPSIIVPMHYKTYTDGPKLTTSAGFLKEMGIAKPEPLPSLKVTKSSIAEETQVVILDPVS